MTWMLTTIILAGLFSLGFSVQRGTEKEGNEC